MFTVRNEHAGDAAGIRRIHSAAFGRPAEADLVDALRVEGLVVASLIAEDGVDLIGHALFSELRIEAESGNIRSVALAPVAVSPAHQGKGVGSALIRAGIERCRGANVAAIIVLGNPKYYNRFGFSSKRAASLRGPFSGEHWMALELKPKALRNGGIVSYPVAFELVD